MEKFDELLEKLKALDLDQTCGDWEEEEGLGNIYEEYLKGNLKLIESDLDVDKHRWYETSTSVYEIFGRFLGVDMATDLFSESMDWEACGVTISFFEMKPVTTITYKAI